MGIDNQFSPGGSKIVNDEPAYSIKAVDADLAKTEKIKKHIEKYIGNPEIVLHEIKSEFVHIDIHWVKPTKEKQFHTLVTSGMSDLPMKAPKELRDWEKMQYIELIMCLPQSWEISEEAFNNEENYWPIRLLKKIARYPHEFSTWLWHGHTIPSVGELHYSNNTNLMCAILIYPYLFNPAILKLEIDAKRTIYFYYLLPIYKEEMEFKLNQGFIKFLEKLKKEDPSFLIINPKRKILDLS